MSDLLERLRDMAAGKHDDLGVAAEAIEEIIDLNWRVVEIEKERDELRALNAQLSVVARACNERLIDVEKERDNLRTQVSEWVERANSFERDLRTERGWKEER